MPYSKNRWRMACAIPLFAAVAALAPSSRAESGGDEIEATQSAETSPQRDVKSIGTITVLGARLSSLPTHIPTTVEGITGKEIEEKINATDAPDALKYFPSLLVRKRYIGDYDHAVLASRASGTGNSARSLVFADGILLSNLLGNGASFTPRWGLVTPEEIERADVLYGPFSAAYSGNAVGAVVDYVTRMPMAFEAHARTGYFMQPFKLYRTDATYSGNQLSAAIGSRAGAFSWWLNVNRLDSASQPLVFATRLRSQGVAASGGIAVAGAIADRNPRNQDWLILGTSNQIGTIQEHAKIKLAYDLTPALRASYVFGAWRNSANRDAETYLRDADGKRVWNGSINIDGQQYNLSTADFALSRAAFEHFIHGVTLKSSTRGIFDWAFAASAYDYSKDLTRSAATAPPQARDGGAGRITDQRGTAWQTLSLKGVWRPLFGTGQSASGNHVVEFGVQNEHHKLRNEVSNTSNWIDGGAESRFAAFRGDTSLASFYAQDTVSFAGRWRATLGARAERWQARNGVLANASTTLGFAARSENEISPKLALAYQATPALVLKASLGRAIRFPTVSELYQGTIAVNAIVNNDPALKAEKSWTSEFTAERELASGNLRTTLFFENTRDALYSQTNVTVTPSVTNVQNVDRIRTRGAEIALTVRDAVIQNLEISSSVTFTDSKIVANEKFPASVGKWQPRVPQWRANLLATYRYSEALSFTFGTRYSGRQYGTLDNSDPNAFAYTGFSRFLVSDIRARYRFTKTLAAAIGIDNLNNAKYWAFHPYPQRTVLADLKFDF